MKHLLLLALASTALAVEPGFEPIFDGKTLDGWKHGGNWSVVNGEMACIKKGGSLVYEKAKVPDDFELRFDWKVAKGCNSGVYYRPTQYEYQLLDNANSPYGENPRQAAASLFFGMAPTKDVVKPFGEWNEGRIVCKGTVIQHWLNGEKVIDFDYTDPRWHNEIEVLRIRGGDLTKRGANLSLQYHGADVWFKNLRWRTIPADEKVVSENLTPMPISDGALRKEQERVNKMLAGKKGDWRHEEGKRFKAEEAHQGVAVDAEHFYAITNAAIGKYRKDTGERVGGWNPAAGGHIKHLNAGVVLDGKLWCAHSNYPEMPMKSSVEVFDPQTMQHLESIDLTSVGGSLTWVDRRDGWWYACFAQYAKTGNPARTRVVRFDLNWKTAGEIRFPPEAVAKFGKNSSSGGSFGPDRHLFITGHDASELYVMDLPVTGDVWTWKTMISISARGQAFAWDRSAGGVLYSIDRKKREVIVSRVTGD
ncbi:DUF1080 domain-containing protein [Prosthecobacter sp.]|uniref:3-keto-disaccharide hydrolase n=1 Tax=Prosthecobacter sp. TaxID=1965333 RepID=UPI002ABB2381|nr:DUF1080 domain-containing protein [Prosthecobacter sp.]MDZ4402805.1 DUF1080 domain-containing protein [Prosthecobacter sp.]